MKVLVYYIFPSLAWKERAQAFYESYQQHAAGIDHDFIVVHKSAFDDPIFDGQNIVHHSNYGYDIGTLQKLSEQYSDYDVIVQMGGHARILHDNWLHKIVEPFKNPKVAMVGTSGSLEQRPHIRTANVAFRPSAMNTVIFPEFLESKESQYEFEHGENSAYNQLLTSGYLCGMVDKSGTFYTDNWRNTKTYRAGEQENLLVADRHTDAYEYGVIGQRIYLRKLAWDDEMDIE